MQGDAEAHDGVPEPALRRLLSVALTYELVPRSLLTCIRGGYLRTCGILYTRGRPERCENAFRYPVNNARKGATCREANPWLARARQGCKHVHRPWGGSPEPRNVSSPRYGRLWTVFWGVLMLLSSVAMAASIALNQLLRMQRCSGCAENASCARDEIAGVAIRPGRALQIATSSAITR